LILDYGGTGLDLAMRAQDAGHHVKLCLKADKREQIGKGVVDVVTEFKPWLRWSDLTVVTDNTKYIPDLERHAAEGGLVIAPNQVTAAWEHERMVGQRVFTKAGISVLPAVEFHDYDEAIKFVKRTMGRFVSKPNGATSNDKALSYCSSGPADMVYMLERWKKSNKLKNSFVLQEFMPGIEMGVSGWFGPEGFIGVWEENFEFKKMMNDDMGVATGEQGTILRYVRHSKLADLVLKPLEKQLKAQRYIGDVDVNCIIDEKGTPWPLEFTTRLGWPAFQLQMTLLKPGEDPLEWLYGLAIGQPHVPFLLGPLAIGVVLSVPDYPYSRMTGKEIVGIPIYGVTPKLRPHIHFSEAMWAEAPVEIGDRIEMRPMWVTAGDYVLTMTALAKTVQDAKTLVYRRLSRIKKRMPSSPMYRTDIGDRLSAQLPILQKQGFAKGLKYSP
jgi:phosphoribosylamine--glycine ligase